MLPFEIAQIASDYSHEHSRHGSSFWKALTGEGKGKFPNILIVMLLEIDRAETHSVHRVHRPFTGQKKTTSNDIWKQRGEKDKIGKTGKPNDHREKRLGWSSEEYTGGT